MPVIVVLVGSETVDCGGLGLNPRSFWKVCNDLSRFFNQCVGLIFTDLVSALS